MSQKRSKNKSESESAAENNTDQIENVLTADTAVAREGAVSTDAGITLVNVKGIEKVSQEFKDKVVQIAGNLNVNPNFLMAVMSFESGETFSPKIKNPLSGAVGLIQFMPNTAKGLGTSSQALEQMSAVDQLDFVAKHFAPFRNRLNTLEDTYMAVLFPAAVGKGSDHVIFKKPSKNYAQNSGLDSNGNGEVTVGEAAAKVRAKLGDAPVGTGEVLRRGVFSPEVGKLQDELIDLGYLKPEQKATGPNRFGPLTEGALKRFQRDNQIGETGIYDADTQDAIRQLNEGVKRGSRSNVVLGLQLRLVTLGYMTLAEVSAGNKNFGPITETALKTFQIQHGINPANGVLTDETYRALLASAPTPPSTIPSTDSTKVDTVLPAEGRGFTTYRREQGGADQFGRASTIRAIMEIAEAWAMRHTSPRLQFGDISRRGGGPFSPHHAHQKGLEVDVRPITNNGREEPSDIHAMNYSRQLTQEFVMLVKEKFPNVKIFFNDTHLINQGLTSPLAGHDNHLHLRFPG